MDDSEWREPAEESDEDAHAPSAGKVGGLGTNGVTESPSGRPLRGEGWTDTDLPRRNRLLAALPGESHERLRPKLEPVELELKEILWEEEGPILHVYFPVNGVISMVVTMRDGSSVEVGTVGNEGMAGLPVFLGAARTNLRAFAQVPGVALRMAADDLRAEVAENAPLRDLLHRYTQALFSLTAQAAACNRIHTAGQRLALWLALCRDRVGVDTFPLTQEFMAQMVGVQRTTVTEEAARLQRADAIRYSRGVLTVTDRRALDAAACECLGVIRREYDRLLGPAAPPSP
jgi:CRP-like cAMP-binding protein